MWNLNTTLKNAKMSCSSLTHCPFLTKDRQNKRTGFELRWSTKIDKKKWHSVTNLVQGNPNPKVLPNPRLFFVKERGLGLKVTFFGGNLFFFWKMLQVRHPLTKSWIGVEIFWSTLCDMQLQSLSQTLPIFPIPEILAILWVRCPPPHNTHHEMCWVLAV